MTKTTPLSEQQIKSIMPEFADFGEKVVGKATLYYLCEMALRYLDEVVGVPHPDERDIPW